MNKDMAKTEKGDGNGVNEKNC